MNILSRLVENIKNWIDYLRKTYNPDFTELFSRSPVHILPSFLKEQKIVVSVYSLDTYVSIPFPPIHCTLWLTHNEIPLLKQLKEIEISNTNFNLMVHIANISPLIIPKITTYTKDCNVKIIGNIDMDGLIEICKKIPKIRTLNCLYITNLSLTRIIPQNSEQPLCRAINVDIKAEFIFKETNIDGFVLAVNIINRCLKEKNPKMHALKYINELIDNDLEKFI